MISATVPVRASLAQILVALGQGELDPYYQVRYTPWIKWAKNSDREVLGRVPYLKQKYLSANLFHMYVHSSDASGARLTVSVEPTGMNKMRAVLYGLGCLFCVVGIIFPFLGFRLNDQRVQSMASDVTQAVSRWEAARGASR